LEDLQIEMHEMGLTDLVVLLINRAGEQDYVNDVEDYDLPILQDTEQTDVFGLWDAVDYDLFIVSRDGVIVHAQVGVHPIEDHDDLVAILSTFL